MDPKKTADKIAKDFRYQGDRLNDAIFKAICDAWSAGSTQADRAFPFFCLIMNPRNCSQPGIMRFKKLKDAKAVAEVISKAYLPTITKVTVRCKVIVCGSDGKEVFRYGETPNGP